MELFNRRGWARALSAAVAMAVLGAVFVAGCGGSKESSAPVSKRVDTFTDDRDGQKYRTVKIGNQTWTAENIRFNVGDSWCYENSADSCKKYGRLYNWNMAKVACPKGWHLPSRDEWTELVAVVGSETGGKKLKSKSGWKEVEGKSGNGTDDYGFSALPGGNRYSDGTFSYAGNNGYWWTATEYSGEYAYRRNVNYNYDDVNEYNRYKSYGFAVRCLAD